MPRRKRVSELESVLSILREVRGIVEAAGGLMNLPTTPIRQTNLAEEDAKTLDDILTAGARAELKALHDPEGKLAEWRKSGTGRNT